MGKVKQSLIEFQDKITDDAIKVIDDLIKDNWNDDDLDVNILKKNKDNPRKAWRSINLNTIFSIRMRGKEWVK